MGGHTKQSNAAAEALYENGGVGSFDNAGPGSDAGDVVMARWLQSAGLQHLASNDIDHRVLPNFLMQGNGAQSAEEKHRIYKNDISSGESGSEPSTPTAEAPGEITASDGFCPSEFRGDYGTGLLDLHGSDTELLSEHVISEPVERSPFMLGGRKELNESNLSLKEHKIGKSDTDVISEPFRPSLSMPGGGKEFNNESNISIKEQQIGKPDADALSEPFEPSQSMPGDREEFNEEFSSPIKVQQIGKSDADVSVQSSVNAKENTRENNVAKIKVVVRKRPLNKKEIAKKEDDIVTVSENACLTVHEPKLKVDLTAYVDKHEFCFDAVLDENVSNDEVYRVTVEPIIPTIFQRTKATCFAYGQTGSGKTFTMQPLPLRAASDLVRLLHQPVYLDQKFKLWLSFFEIYGGKVFDLLGDRKKLCMREDARQQVCIVGLQEFEVSDVQIVKEYIEKGSAARSTGSTGANEESSRSHAILQLALKKHNMVKKSKRNNDGNETKNGKVVGKISFIDLAGSERGADTTDNDRQTRIEGAEINKSLLALKECIRALDNDQTHIPFRGSKLTEVLRDSFVGNSKTVMVSCISPNEGSCEHTLNTLRYADRVKSLSKSGSASARRDQSNSTPSIIKDTSAPSEPATVDFETYRQQQEKKAPELGKRAVEKDNLSCSPTAGFTKQTKSGSLRKDQASSTPSFAKNTLAPSKPATADAEIYQQQEKKVSELGRKVVDKDNLSSSPTATSSKQTKSGNPPKEQANSVQPVAKNTLAPSQSATAGVEIYQQQPENKVYEQGRKVVEKDNPSSTLATGFTQQNPNYSLSRPTTGCEERGAASVPVDTEKSEVKNSDADSKISKMYSSYAQNSCDAEEKLKTLLSPLRKASGDEKPEKLGNWQEKDGGGSGLLNTVYNQRSLGLYEIQNVSLPLRKASGDEKPEKLRNWQEIDGDGSVLLNNIHKQQSLGSYDTNNIAIRKYEPESSSEENVDAIIEEEEALIAAHRKEIEDTMEIVREEMKLLAEVDQPGSDINNYVNQLSITLSRKLANLVGLQSRLAGFQLRLKEQEILSQQKVPR